MSTMSHMALIYVQRHPNGPRLYVADHRVHHGTSGLVLCAACLLTRRPRTALAMLALALHDAHDWRVWFKRELLSALDETLAMVEDVIHEPAEGTLAGRQVV
jgi:hypothetical protein